MNGARTRCNSSRLHLTLPLLSVNFRSSESSSISTCRTPSLLLVDSLFTLCICVCVCLRVAVARLPRHRLPVARVHRPQGHTPFLHPLGPSLRGGTLRPHPRHSLPSFIGLFAPLVSVTPVPPHILRPPLRPASHRPPRALQRLAATVGRVHPLQFPSPLSLPHQDKALRSRLPDPQRPRSGAGKRGAGVGNYEGRVRGSGEG